MLKYARLLPGFQDVIKKLAVKKTGWKIIGDGCYGVAYDIGNNLVCKVTRSINEVKAALKLKKQKNRYRYLYYIKDVFVLKKNNRFQYGLIITPKYDKLSYKETNELLELFAIFTPSPYFRVKSLKQIKNIINNETYKSYYHFYDNNTINVMAKRRIALYNKYNIHKILYGLKRAHIRINDLSHTNILKHKGRYVLIDVAF